MPKGERDEFVRQMRNDILTGVMNEDYDLFLQFAADNDTYIRKNAYMALASAYRDVKDSRASIREFLSREMENLNEFVRQTVVYTLGEIGRFYAANVMDMLGNAIQYVSSDKRMRSAVVGSLKRIGEKNPAPALEFARKFLDHPDPTIRKEVIHGIELRGRTNPEEVLPILRDAQHDTDAKVRNMIVHVIAQISYKEGCLETVLAAIRDWDNIPLVQKTLEEIVEVHWRYAKFSAMTPQEAEQYIRNNFPDFFS
jgi:hypothetical protein